MRLPDKATGNGRHKLADRGADMYPTPPEAVRALLAAESFPQDVWEPAAGLGAIVDVLRAQGHRVVATELVDYGDASPGILTGIDFLKTAQAPKGVSCIITNPPYKLATEFVRHGLALVPKVALLMRLAFLEGRGRSDILDGGRLARVLVFRDRLPMMHRHNWTGPRSTSAMAFCWCIWDADHAGPTQLSRISWRDHQQGGMQ